jgi:sialic acid synthase SpsE
MVTARELVRIAAGAGADYAKFQLYDAADAAPDDPEAEWFARVQLDADKLEMLRACCEDNRIRPLCTPWDVDKAATRPCTNAAIAT